MTQIGPMKFKKETFIDALESMIETREVIPVSYTVPSSNTRVLYFPWGTKFNI